MSINRKCQKCRRFQYLNSFRSEVYGGFVCATCEPSQHQAIKDREILDHYGPGWDCPIPEESR